MVLFLTLSLIRVVLKSSLFGSRWELLSHQRFGTRPCFVLFLVSTGLPVHGCSAVGKGKHCVFLDTRKRKSWKPCPCFPAVAQILGNWL